MLALFEDGQGTLYTIGVPKDMRSTQLEILGRG